MSAKVWGFVAIGLSAVALLLQIVGVSIPNWYHGSFTGGTRALGDFGLWKFCTEVASLSISACFDYPLTADFLKATRAMELIALFLMAGAIVVVGLKMFVMRHKDIFVLVSAGMAFGAGVFAAIGMIVYGIKMESPGLTDTRFGTGFFLCIISAILMIVTGAVLILVKVKGKE